MKLALPLASYFQGVYTELRKVVWPNFSQVVRYLMAVVFSIALATAFIGGVDYLLVKFVLPIFIKGI